MRDDIKKMEDKAFNGERVTDAEFLALLQTFENIVIWGAGNLGTAIGGRILDCGCRVSAYWDIRHDEIRERLGIKVVAPYDGGFNKNSTLVIFSVASVPVAPYIRHQLAAENWPHILNGIAVLEGVLCPFDLNSGVDAGVCNRMETCTLCACDRLHNIHRHTVSRREKIPAPEMLSVDRVHFIINNRCNLKCTHCNRYMNSYFPEERRDSDLADIIADIDAASSAIDSIGVAIIFGGEPFLHPGLDCVVGELLKRNNICTVMINTNGLVDMKKHKIDNMRGGRVRVAFSNYGGIHTERQKELFYGNVQYLNSEGVLAMAQNQLETWFAPSKLIRDAEYSEEEMRKARKRCDFPYLFVYEHMLFPCLPSLITHDLRISDYPDEYVRLDSRKSPVELKRDIVALRNRDFHPSCSFCCQRLILLDKAAEQGWSDRYRRPPVAFDAVSPEAMKKGI